MTDEPTLPQSGEELYNAVRGIWPYLQRAKKYINEPGIRPADWRGEIRSILDGFWMHISKGMAESPDDIMEAIGDDQDFGEHAVKALVDAIGDWLCWSDKSATVARVMQEYSARDHRDALELERVLHQLNRPLIGSTELSLHWDGSPARVGQVLKALGHEKRRVSGRGDNQYLWILKDHERYRAMSNLELRAAWHKCCMEDQEATFL